MSSRRVAIACVVCAASAIAVPSLGHGQTTPSKLKTTVNTAEGLIRVLYELTVTGANGPVVRFELPRGGLLDGAERLSGHGCDGEKTPAVEKDLFVWSCVMKGNQAQLSFAVSGGSAKVKLEGTGKATVLVAGRPEAFPHTHVLTLAADTPGLQPVVGGGFAFLVDDREDFQVKDDTLLVTNDSPKRAVGLAGVLVRLGRVKNREVGLHSSFQFIQGDNAFLDGISFGFSVELNPLAHLTAGVLMRKGKELGPGFKRDASTIINAATDTSSLARFRGYNPDGKQSTLDGLPLLSGTGVDAKPFYSGDVLVDSYNWSYFVGIVVPIRLGELIGKAAKK